MSQVVLEKTEEAINDSDIVFFMVDAREGVTEADKHYARYVLFGCSLFLYFRRCYC